MSNDGRWAHFFLHANVSAINARWHVLLALCPFILELSSVPIDLQEAWQHWYCLPWKELWNSLTFHPATFSSQMIKMPWKSFKGVHSSIVQWCCFIIHYNTWCSLSCLLYFGIWTSACQKFPAWTIPSIEAHRSVKRICLEVFQTPGTTERE